MADHTPTRAVASPARLALLVRGHVLLCSGQVGAPLPKPNKCYWDGFSGKKSSFTDVTLRRRQQIRWEK